MEGLWDRVVVWFFALGDQYGVDPIVFGSIHVGVTPLCVLSVAWLIKTKKSQKSLTFPMISPGLWFIKSYL